MDWQRIKTAPRNGEDIILAQWYEGSLQWITKGRWTTTSTWYVNTHRVGAVTDWHGSNGTPLRPPTHWCAVPVCPDKAEADLMPMVTGVAYDLAFQYAMAEAKILARQFCESCGYSEDDQDYWAKCMQDAVAGALPSPTVVRRTNRPPEEPSDG